MRKTRWLVSLLFIVFSANSIAATAATLIDQLQAQRQAFSQDNKIDLQQLSREIQATVKDADVLDRTHNDQQAINVLLGLQKYAPLAQFPSYDVQMQCANLYARLQRNSDAQACRERAAALAEILRTRSGSGATPDDPVRVITINEIGEWARSQSAKMSDVRAYANLQAVTYSSPTTDGQSKVAYFLFDPRLQASISSKKIDIFDPLPVGPADGKYQLALNQAREARIQFLNDKSFNYPELIQLSDQSQREAMQLAQQGDIQGALAKIREVEKIRPIQQIPVFNLISNYSFLLGKSGDLDAQSKMRLFLFGITQDIAHSGNGLTQESAVHVVAISEEYTWLHEKNLRVTKQHLLMDGNSRYDAMDTVDANGNLKTYYFDVSQVFTRESPVPAQ
ncbi:DUF4919 domain-containing protein [Paraburkholderia sp. ZP32-5]|uniref:DUF4919 domain-containing protein n=1 Tax=Paraburkholderia sp. ZP32-5 TaxID=2883245 RepID=UPI001F22E28C|nr:DUF4919 domain-containing protein [Paraburkholderia sp. ZP32-5]